jgi:tRNA1(Val) A37 N6-methylase TrmN6
MTRVEYFLKNSEVRKYSIQGKDILLEIDDKVFPPKNAPILSRNMKIKKDESVIDVGTGSGILGIAAAKLGGKVELTDCYENSIKLALKNAQLNKCQIKGSVCDFFDSKNKNTMSFWPIFHRPLWLKITRKLWARN